MAQQKLTENLSLFFIASHFQKHLANENIKAFGLGIRRHLSKLNNTNTGGLIDPIKHNGVIERKTASPPMRSVYLTHLCYNNHNIKIISTLIFKP